MIEVSNLSKSFRVHKKQPGLAGSVRGLFNRQWETKHALKEISLKVEAGEIKFNPDGSVMRTSKFNVTTGISAIDEPLKVANNNPDLVLYKLKSSAAKFTFLLVPLSLPFMWLMFCWRREVTMYDHAVFVLYSLCFMALLAMSISVLKFFSFKLTALLLFGLAPIHMFLQLRHTYGLGVWGTLWRTAALQLAAFIIIVLYLLAVLALTIK